MIASLFLLSLGLAADAFAVAVGQGAAVRERFWRTALVVGAAFGASQTIAPLIGWSLGVAFAGLIGSFDHWIAFAVLAVLGAKMIWEGARSDPPGKESDPGKERIAGPWALVLLSLATSIDAAAAGLTLPTIGAPILISIATIGLVTFALSIAGVWLGRLGSRALGANAEIAGGAILVVIGLKVLFDHHTFG